MLFAVLNKPHLNFDVGELGVDAEREVARQGPGGRRPGDHLHVGVLVKRKADDDGRIRHLLVVLRRLEVGQRRRAAGGVGHHPEASVDEALVPELTEHPPVDKARGHCFFGLKCARISL